MKCTLVQNRLLALPDFHEVPAKLQVHLDQCNHCQTWFARLIKLEASIPRLRVPKTDGKIKAALLQTIRSSESVSRSPQPVKKITPPQPVWSLSTLVERYWHGGLIAATLLIGTIAFLGLGTQATQVVAMPADPLLQELVDANLSLQEADSPAKRMTKLVAIAEKLHGEIREIANVDAEGQNLIKLSKLYNRVVMEGIVDYAREIPFLQRNDLLIPITQQLAEAEKKAEELAQTVQPNAVQPLRNVAYDSKQAMVKLHELIRGKT